MSQDTTYHLGHISLEAKQWSCAVPSAPHVVMLHGWLDNAASFIRLANHLSQYHLTALDLAGHGLSEHKPAGSFYHLWDYALDVISVLNTLNHAVWLVGHSMGGSVAMLVAALAPDKIRGLVVLDSMGPATTTPEERVTTMQRAMQKMLKARPVRAMRYTAKEDLIQARMNGFTSLSYEAAAPIVERGALCSDGKWGWRADPKLAFPSPFRMDEASVDAFVAAIKCPTLALLAEQGMYCDKLDLIKQRCTVLPTLETKWLPGNHHFHLEPLTSSAVAEEIQRFIDQN